MNGRGCRCLQRPAAASGRASRALWAGIRLPVSAKWPCMFGLTAQVSNFFLCRGMGVDRLVVQT